MPITGTYIDRAKKKTASLVKKREGDSPMGVKVDTSVADVMTTAHQPTPFKR